MTTPASDEQLGRPEMDSLAEYLPHAPASWEQCHRQTWADLQACAVNKARWMAYAKNLEGRLDTEKARADAMYRIANELQDQCDKQAQMLAEAGKAVATSDDEDEGGFTRDIEGIDY